MEKRLLSGIIVIFSLLLVLSVLPVHGEEKIYDTVVRLHVLANSDSEEDQAIKLKVRDAVLSLTAPLLESCKTQAEAEAVLTEHTEEIRAAAIAALRQNGRSEDVFIELGQEEYPTRSYDSICFPSGEYLSLRVCIGEAEGQNWWCCLFPPLCLGSSTVSSAEAEDSFLAVGLTPSQYKIITESDKPVYKLRFKILELFG